MAIISYLYNDRTQLSKNFNVSEFRCKCGKVHNTKISNELIAMLQRMTDTVKADYVTISSGYRCSTHDRNVGGSDLVLTVMDMLWIVNLSKMVSQ